MLKKEKYIAFIPFVLPYWYHDMWNMTQLNDPPDAFFGVLLYIDYLSRGTKHVMNYDLRKIDLRDLSRQRILSISCGKLISVTNRSALTSL